MLDQVNFFEGEEAVENKIADGDRKPKFIMQKYSSKDSLEDCIE